MFRHLGIFGSGFFSSEFCVRAPPRGQVNKRNISKYWKQLPHRGTIIANSVKVTFYGGSQGAWMDEKQKYTLVNHPSLTNGTIGASSQILVCVYKDPGAISTCKLHRERLWESKPDPCVYKATVILKRSSCLGHLPLGVPAAWKAWYGGCVVGRENTGGSSPNTTIIT